MDTTSRHMPYVKALDGMRALSILLVILTHTAPLGPDRWFLNWTFGPMGMSLFFCLSGFLIVSILYRDQNVPAFLVRRVLRIVPALVVYLAIVAVLFDLDARVIWINLLFVTNYWFEGLGQGDQPLSHLWSLSVEMQFYVAVALVVLALGRRGLWLVVPAAFVITGFRIEANAYVNIQTHLRVDEILAGGILALVTIHRGAALQAFFVPRPWLAFALLIGFGTLWSIGSHPLGGEFNYLRPYSAAAMTGMVIYARFWGLHAILESRPAAYVARTSYALYIYHPLMVTGWLNSGGDWTRYLLKRPISYALTLFAAHASTFWWERHWQALARRLARRLDPASPRSDAS